MTKTAVLVHGRGNPLATTTLFRVGLAQTLEDLAECQRLRFLVFNCELGEGLDASTLSGLDRDQFDFICDHLMVHDSSTGKLVGTYRMQNGYRAKGNLGYYGESLFDFSPFESIRGQVLELGRACVHQEYRNAGVLHMLWKGIARYAEKCGARYLLGCSSLTSQDESAGMALYEALRESIWLNRHCEPLQSPGTNAIPMASKFNRQPHRACSALIWTSLLAFAALQPSTENSRPSIF